MAASKASSTVSGDTDPSAGGKADLAGAAASKSGNAASPRVTRKAAAQKGAKTPAGKAVNRLSIRLDLASGARIGPGKVAVLEEIARSGSISAAGRALHISYRRTWELVEDLNASLGAPVVQTAAGGSGGGGASLTELGHAVVTRYRSIEADCAATSHKHLVALQRLTRGRPSG